MADDRLFPLDGIPEVPLFREPPPGRGALIMDERISHDYPPRWHKCPFCAGDGESFPGSGVACRHCLGMGSVKAMVRLLADHRCERCHHLYIPKGDAKMLDVDPTPYRWSPCDERCTHLGQVRMRETYRPGDYEWSEYNLSERGGSPSDFIIDHGPGGEPIRRWEVEAEWRVLTVHHLDGDKANLSWWNLAALCQRCHLEIQAKVVLERVYPHEHSEWFKPHAAGWYAYAYLGEDLTRTEVAARMDELLALESVPA